MEVKIVKTVNVSSLRSLYIEAQWLERDDQDSTLEDIVKNSLAFAAVFNEKGELIGIGRAISDGVSDAYIQDVVISLKYRKLGLGKKIIEVLVNYLKSKNIGWIGLIAAPNTYKFYESLGFEILKDHIPMRLK